MQQRRFGIISISRDLIDHPYIGILFQRFIPIKADYDFCTDSFMYSGFSKYFREVPLDKVAPQYKVELVISTKNGNCGVFFTELVKGDGKP